MVVYGRLSPTAQRRLMDAFWAVPEWAPADESHLVGSSSVVTKIAYGKGSVTYSTFDAQSTDVLRLDFAPESVMANGRPLPRRQILPSMGSGFVFDESTRVLRIRHDAARDIDVQGHGGNAPFLYVTFDDPHLAAGTALEGAYPSEVIDWPRGEWKIGIPDGKFGTFNLLPASSSSELHFFVHFAAHLRRHRRQQRRINPVLSHLARPGTA